MINISLDESHHIKNGKPLYSTRYKKVMSFHNGIAPVETNTNSFFINLENQRLFDRTFVIAYGFYNELASIKDKSGFFHIDTSGKDLYKERYKWTGNFNEYKCVVRDFENNYYHINNCGKKIYDQNYTYVGDFKYGIAVVMNKSGKSTHITEDGDLLHAVFFDELNIFHKGYAIAKDEDGFFHINKNGKGLYCQRYKKLEDFYNGSALATTFENEKIILYEDGFIENKLTKANINKNKILDDSFSYFKYQILFAILKLNVLKNIDQNKDLNLPVISVKLIFRWLYSQKIIDENNNLTSLGKVLEYELKTLILYWQDLPFKTVAHMVETLKTGSEYFSNIFEKPYFEFLEQSNEHAKLSFEMNRYYNLDYSNLIKYLGLKNEIVCDVGGGNGKLTEEISRQYPNVITIIIDKQVNEKLNNFRRIDFFDSFEINSNVFILSRILHDWNDQKALIILKNVSKNMKLNSTLYIFESIVSKNSDKGLSLSFHLLNFVGGYERTLNEFKDLLTLVNLKILEVYEEDSLVSIMKVIKL